MGKHLSDKLSQTFSKKSNKAGMMPQNPNVGSNSQNMYR